MKKVFPLTHPKIKPERLVDATRAEVNKYLKRERRKQLPEGMDYWDFKCKVGASAETAKSLHVAELSQAIGQMLEEGNETCYIELVAKPAKRLKKDSD